MERDQSRAQSEISFRFAEWQCSSGTDTGDHPLTEPGIFDRYRFEVLSEPFLLIRGVLQNLDGVISVKAGQVEGLRAGATAESHDFH